jgi:hypothetical protein
MLNGPYVVINQLIKSIGKVTHQKQLFDIHVLGGKIYQSNKK